MAPIDPEARIAEGVKIVINAIEGQLEVLELPPEAVLTFLVSVEAAVNLKSKLHLLEGIQTSLQGVEEHTHDYEDPRHGVGVPTSKAKLGGHLLSDLEDEEDISEAGVYYGPKGED